MGNQPRTYSGWVCMEPQRGVGGRWARAPDSYPPPICISFLFRMERAPGERGRDLRGQPGPWELHVGLLLSGERAW